MVHLIENFFGCYLLHCVNPKFKGRTYIGFTVNPKRRIAQHNAGKHKGGAWRTSGRGPWHMTLIVHGFPSDIAALRFEWAWQHPERSRRLRHLPLKSRKETPYQYRVRILSHMLCERPWSVLPLTVRWLMQEYFIELSPPAPSHIPIAYGPVDVKAPSKESETEPKPEAQNKTKDAGYASLIERIEKKLSCLTEEDGANYDEEICGVCGELIESDVSLKCTEDCQTTFHMKCLARTFLKGFDQIIPVEGNCPKCGDALLWGDLIRNSKGFHQYLGSGELL